MSEIILNDFEDYVKISNVRVYDLEESIQASKFPKSVDISQCNTEITERQISLGNCITGTGHDCYLKGIICNFNLTCSNKMWVEFQRYHFADIVSSQSTMHKITQMDLKNKSIKHSKIKHVEKYCLACGKKLNHGNQKFCLECLIIGDASPNFKYRQMCKHLLWSRGFSSNEITLKRRELIKKNGYNYIHLFDNATIGEKLSQIIKELGYSNKELSKILYSNCKCISDYRNNKKAISDDFAELIADKFNVSAEWLLNGKE